jgi:O-antigen ligase
MLKLKKHYQHYHYLFPSAFLLLLPLGILHNLALGLWLLSFILIGDFRLNIRSVPKNKFSFISIAFFLLYLLYYLKSQNKIEAGITIEMKGSFLIFPILFFSHSYSYSEIKKILLSFIIGCISACLFCITRASYFYLFKNENVFFYTDFSILLHPSYTAMYNVLAILITLLYLPEWLKSINYKFIIIGIVFLFLTICVFLCASKMGLLSYILLVPICMFYLLLKARKLKILLLLSVLFLATFTLAYRYFPEPFSRIKAALSVTKSTESIDKSATESTAVRILVWTEALEIIKNNIWLGVSPGDANEALYKGYKEKNLTGALEKKLNAHNEFLQIGIGMGLVGLTVLIVMFIWGTYKAMQNKNLLLGLFIVLLLLNFLVESMLQRQSGTLFFASFLCLFLHTDFLFSNSCKTITK